MTESSGSSTKQEGFSADDDSMVGDRLHQLLNCTVAFAALLTPQGLVKDVSHNALAVAGIGLSDVKGRPFWDGYWFGHSSKTQRMIREAVERAAEGETVRFDYVARVMDDQRLTIDFQVAPIRAKDGTVAEVVASGFDVTDREIARTRLEMLLREQNHRIRNLFSTIRAIANMTFRLSAPEEALPRFTARIDALAAAHSAVENLDGEGSLSFPALARKVLRPHMLRSAAVRISGPEARLRRDVGKMLGLCLHELASNAVRYGALSGDEGWIDVRLSRTEAGAASFSWVENGGASAPTEHGQGYGMRFVTSSLRGIFGAPAELEFRPEGLSLVVKGAVEDIFVT